MLYSSHTKIPFKISVILNRIKIFLKCRKFQPRYSMILYSHKIS